MSPSPFQMMSAIRTNRDASSLVNRLLEGRRRRRNIDIQRVGLAAVLDYD